MNGFHTCLSHITMTIPNYSYSGLTPRELEIINMMIQRPAGTKRKEVYKKMAEQSDIDLETAEKYHKQARAKLNKSGHRLPGGF